MYLCPCAYISAVKLEFQNVAGMAESGDVQVRMYDNLPSEIKDKVVTERVASRGDYRPFHNAKQRSKYAKRVGEGVREENPRLTNKFKNQTEQENNLFSFGLPFSIVFSIFPYGCISFLLFL